MFVLNPDPYLLPSYRISPFVTSDIRFNNSLPDDDNIDDYFLDRFTGRRFYYTFNGRAALRIALSNYDLHEDDIVTIFTTSGNHYISSCVTREITSFCKWSRDIEIGTKLILVNHEFGLPYAELMELKKKGIPIIEDCAHSFFSKDKDNKIGNVGDFVIYSFPKMFPIQVGGLLVCNAPKNMKQSNLIDIVMLKYIKNVLSYHIKSEREIIKKRIHNFNYLRNKFELSDFSARFHSDCGTIPGVFMFRTDRRRIDLPELKQYFYAHGIQCSVFYGEEAFFIPVHQALNEDDMDYFHEVMLSFIK